MDQDGHNGHGSKVGEEAPPPFGMEVGLGLGHIVLDGDPALSLPICGPFLLWLKGWMHQDVT